MEKVRIGFIKYVNSIPFYHDYDSVPIDKLIGEACGDGFEFEIIYEAPSRLNEMISNGALDIAAISAFEYVRNRENLQMLNKISISAFESVMSVLLISKRAMTDLSNRHILASDESASSTSLLKILAEDFFDNKNVKYAAAKISASAIDGALREGRADAVMAIGDQALKYIESRGSSKADPDGDEDGIKIFDLCSLWNQFTALPFVFAIMAAKKDFYFANKTICDRISGAVKSKIKFFVANRDIFAAKASKLSGISENTMKKYYGLLNYEFMPEHIMALEEFEKRLKKLEILPGGKNSGR